MAITTQTPAPWGLARISHRPKLTVSALRNYEHDATGGEGVDVYVLSSGLGIHEDLVGRVRTGVNLADREYANTDFTGRGTRLAGLTDGRF